MHREGGRRTDERRGALAARRSRHRSAPSPPFTAPIWGGGEKASLAGNHAMGGCTNIYPQALQPHLDGYGQTLPGAATGTMPAGGPSLTVQPLLTRRTEASSRSVFSLSHPDRAVGSDKAPLRRNPNALPHRPHGEQRPAPRLSSTAPGGTSRHEPDAPGKRGERNMAQKGMFPTPYSYSGFPSAKMQRPSAPPATG